MLSGDPQEQTEEPLPVGGGCPLLVMKRLPSVGQEDEGEPACLRSLSASGIMSESLFCFSTSLFSRCLSASLLLVAEIETSSEGFGVQRNSRISKTVGMSGA